MSSKLFAVGILVQNRWDLTKLTLQSLLESTQDPKSYDLYLIDNGSNEFNQALLKSWADNHDYANMFCFQSPVNLSIAWNLFLSFTSSYGYRTLIDNDIILKGTGPAKYIDNEEAVTASHRPEETAGVNPGAPKNVSIIRGPGAIRATKRRNPEAVGSSFLDEAQKYMTKYQVGMLSYVPITPTYTFETMIQALAKDRYRGLPYLMGGCVTISKRCLDVLGYYDERLSRNVVLDYSQRAIGARVNIGYHDDLWIAHNVLGDIPNQEEDREARRVSFKYLENDPKTKRYIGSRWTPIIDDIRKCAGETKVVNFK